MASTRRPLSGSAVVFYSDETPQPDCWFMVSLADGSKTAEEPGLIAHCVDSASAALTANGYSLTMIKI